MQFSMEPIMRMPYFKGKEFVVLGSDKKMLFRSIAKIKLNHSLADLENKRFVYQNGWGFLGMPFDNKQFYIGIKDTDERSEVALSIMRDILWAQQAPNKNALLEQLIMDEKQWQSGFLAHLGFETGAQCSIIIATADHLPAEEALQIAEELIDEGIAIYKEQHLMILVQNKYAKEVAEELYQFLTEELLVDPYVLYGVDILKWEIVHDYYQLAKRLLMIGKRLYTSKRHFSVNHLLFAMAIDQSNSDNLLSHVKEKQIQSITDDQELIATVIHFFENNLNVTDTSNRLFIHRNTLLYRLSKIEQMTGYDLRKFEDALNFYYLMTKQLL